ncbi:tetratricopeptide repeat protein [Neisseriaceae bacterium ESL0693]|nr:tetratricopeptide repeat protein [Neisseriaceae bacterium ESL0693]
MAVHLQDEQEIANFKYFWQRWGKWLFGILVILACAYLGWVLYQNHLQSNNAKAAIVLETFVAEATEHKDVQAKKTLQNLQEQYSDTISAAQATLMMAGTAFDQGRYDEAIGHLRWVQKRQKGDLIQTVTAQRLAVIYLQQKKYPEALAALNVKVARQFQPILLDTKGDVLWAQQKPKEAVAAYKQAVDLSSENDPQRQLIQLKLDSLS